MFYKYEVRTVNDYDNEENSDIGITYGKTYTEAMNNLVEDYGNGATIVFCNLEIIGDYFLEMKTLGLNKEHEYAKLFERVLPHLI